MAIAAIVALTSSPASNRHLHADLQPRVSPNSARPSPRRHDSRSTDGISSRIVPRPLVQRRRADDSDALPSSPERVLLVNPPVHDTRLPWQRWMQPTTMLRVSTAYRSQGADIRLLDSMRCKVGDRVTRRRVERITVDEHVLNKWRFGQPVQEMRARLSAMAVEGWIPDVVLIQGLTTFWWEGIVESADLVRQTWPHAIIALLGAYPVFAEQHARAHVPGARMIRRLPNEIQNLATDNNLFPELGSFAYISLGTGGRTAEEVVEEISAKSRSRVRVFAFEDHDIVVRHPVLFRCVLESLAAKPSQVRRFRVLGTIAAEHVASDRKLPELMRRAGFNYIHFADDRASPTNDEPSDEAFLEANVRAAALCIAAGFPARTDQLSASLCLGRSQEDLTRRAALMTRLAHHVGSVIVWPYQPAPDECPDLELQEQNGKLFPFRRRNQTSYREYLDFLGLAAVLNAKYRERTFDFLGEGVISRLLRDSIERRGWDPPQEVKGSLILPMQPIRR